MKKRLSTSRPLWAAAVLVLGLLWVGYKPVTADETWPVPNTKINPDFEKHPPIAQEVYIDLLDQPMPSGSNVVVSASFDEATRARIGGQYLAMKLTSPQPNVSYHKDKTLDYLRDDGYDGDVKANDGIYTKSFKDSDVAGIQSYLENWARQASAPHNAVKFVNRRGVPNNDLKDLVTVTTTNTGKKIKIKQPLGNIVAKPSSNMIDHSLMIRDLSVVEDPKRTYDPCNNTGNPQGPWTFAELMRQLASPNPGSIANDAQTISFIEKWLDTWNGTPTVNGDLLDLRPSNSVITTWLNLSAANGAAPGQLLLENVPFRLMAIVNRVDLRGASGYGFLNAGEARLVFCLLDDNCNPRRMTVIFEYGVPLEACEDVKAWGQAWADLEAFTFPDPSYNDQLQKITDFFTLCGSSPSKPNESSLNQLRTNELTFAGPWQLREFNIIKGNLRNVTTKQEPALKYNAQVTNPDVVLMANWVNANAASILANNYIVPDQVSGIDFLGGKADVTGSPVGPPSPGNNPHHWDGDATPGPAHITTDDVRHIFSLNTCSGCHAGETQTAFTHIDPTGFGSVASISQFLSGAAPSPSGLFMVPDAAGRPSFFAPQMRGFNDLWRRALDLQDLLDSECRPAFLVLHSLIHEPIGNSSH